MMMINMNQNKRK